MVYFDTMWNVETPTVVWIPFLEWWCIYICLRGINAATAVHTQQVNNHPTCFWVRHRYWCFHYPIKADTKKTKPSPLLIHQQFLKRCCWLNKWDLWGTIKSLFLKPTYLNFAVLLTIMKWVCVYYLLLCIVCLFLLLLFIDLWIVQRLSGWCAV